MEQIIYKTIIKENYKYLIIETDSFIIKEKNIKVK